MRLIAALALLSSLASLSSTDVVSDLLDSVEEVEGSDAPWDIDGPCQGFVDQLSAAIGKMVTCAANYTIPPRVCTNCLEEYAKYRLIEHQMHNLAAKTWGNISCSTVVYDNYPISYVRDLADSIQTKIWDQSRCDSCLTFTFNFTANTSDYVYVDHMQKFITKLEHWRFCIMNFTVGEGDLIGRNDSKLCTECGGPLRDLFEFYWHIYTTPGIQFCMDVETTMNDTLRMWNDVWGCAERKDRQKDATLVAITASLLVLFTIFFYLASYIQGGGEVRHFVRYSRSVPRHERQRLLSPSGSDTNLFDSRSVSTSSSGPRVHVPQRRPQ